MVERGGSHPRGILQGLAALLCCLAACDGGGSGDGRTAPGPDAAGPPEDAATRDGGTSGQDGRVEQDGQGEPEAGAADAAGPEDGSGPTDGAAADLGFACRSTADCPGCGHCDRQQGRCVPCRCRLDEDCAHHQVCEEHDCVADCRQTGCAAEMACDEQLRRCVPRQGCRRSSECPGLSVCVEARCVAGDPYGSCDTPQVLLSGVPFAASTRRTRDHAAGSCSRQPSPEAVFTFSLDESAGVRIRVDGSADHFDPLLFLRAGSCRDGEELACRDTRFLLSENLDQAELPAGIYFLFVESFGPEALGDFQVQVDIVPGGLCLDDVLEENDAPEAAGDLALARGQRLLLCPGDADWFGLPLHAGDELLLALTLDEGVAPGAVRLQLLEPGGEPVSLTPLPPPAPAADGEGAAGTTTLLRASALPVAGRYLLAVTGEPDDPAAQDAAGGDGEAQPLQELAGGAASAPEVGPALGYRLEHEVFTAHGTTDCTNPTTLVPGRTVAGDTHDAAGSTAGSCASQLHHDAPEVVYKLHLDAEASVTLEASADWLYTLYLRRSCRSELPENELGCRAPGRLFFPALPPGTYFVFVDGFGEAAGPYTLRLDVGPALHAPAHDGCAGALEIQPGQVVEGTTQLASDDFRGSCTSPLSHVAPDVVYRFTLAEERRVVAELAPVSAGGEPWAAALYVQSQCGSMIAEEGCDSLGLSPRLELVLPAGEHFLVVDGWRNAWGPFSLSLQVE